MSKITSINEFTLTPVALLHKWGEKMIK